MKQNKYPEVYMKHATRKPTPVGDIILYEYLEPLGLKISELAEVLNVHRNTISALVNNNKKLSLDMAHRLAIAFDTSVDFWLNVQAAVDLWEVQNDTRMQEELSRVQTAASYIEKHSSVDKVA